MENRNIQSYQTTIDFLKAMVSDKKQQIKCEPNEPMWKEELTQLQRTIGLVEMDKESIEQKGGAEAGFVAQLLFYPVTEQLFVFNDSRVRCVPAVKKNKKRY